MKCLARIIGVLKLRLHKNDNKFVETYLRSFEGTICITRVVSTVGSNDSLKKNIIPRLIIMLLFLNLNSFFYMSTYPLLIKDPIKCSWKPYFMRVWYFGHIFVVEIKNRNSTLKKYYRSIKSTSTCMVFALFNTISPKRWDPFAYEYVVYIIKS